VRPAARRLHSSGAANAVGGSLNPEFEMSPTCYNRGMVRKRLLWLGKCLLFCLLGMFIAGRLSDLLNPLIWWALHKNGTTLLERPSFIASYYLPLIGMYGLSLGLIPIHRLQELLASSLGKFRFRSGLRPETALSRPMLWAWVPVGLAFLFRLLTFPVKADHSVLGSTAYGVASTG
jgi:hypothetical protein